MGRERYIIVVREGCFEEVTCELRSVLQGNWVKGTWDLCVIFYNCI